MLKMKRISFTLLLACMVSCLQAQLRNRDVYEVTEMEQSYIRTEIAIPDIPGYQTLKCDFHIHTVFSDGKVWPDIRVNEAWQQGLDALAITDHIEYRPHKEILKGDLNESYKIARKAADGIGFIVIKGTEITRDKPLGHLNALFVDDVIPMDVADPLEAINEARKQGAFIMWNHPGWPDDKSTVYPVHEQLIREKKIDGVEVFNSVEYYPVIFDFAAANQLAFMANSDIHNLITGDYGTGLRPMTLVFATEKSEKGIKEALFAKRTAAFFHGELAGKPEFLEPLVMACLQPRRVTGKMLEITNVSDIDFRLTGDNGSLYIIPARKTLLVGNPAAANLTVLNCHTGMDRKLVIATDRFLNRR